MTPRIHQVRDRFVNIYIIVEDDGLSIIDTGTPNGETVLLRSLEKMGRVPQDIHSILITHSDPDHIGSAAVMKQASGARVFASQIEGDALAHGHTSREIKGNALTKQLFNLLARPNSLRPTSVDETVAEGDVLPMLGGLHVVATPGHTPGHVSFYAPAYKTLFAGDSMMALGGKLGFNDGPVTWDYAQGIASVQKQAALGAEQVFCGHGSAVVGAKIAFPF